jgi:polar amino acid transport system substrate-binding protein
MHISTFLTRKRPWYALLIGVMLVLTLLLTACGGENAQPASSTKASVAPPKNLMVPGTLSVGSELTYPPKEFVDTATGKPTGFDIDLITAMADSMGLKTSIVSTRFDTIIDDLNNKRFDIVISGMHVTPAREQKADFIEYARSGESLLVSKGNPENIKTYSDLCGKKVGVQGGTIQQDHLKATSTECTKNGKSPIQVTVLTSQNEVVNLLVNKRVDATLQVDAVSSYYLKQNPGILDASSTIVNATPEGIAVRKGDTAMNTSIQKAFAAVKADGTYKKLLDKWGLSNEAI